MATLRLVKTDSETDSQYLLQGTGDNSQNADFSLFTCDGEGGDPFAFGNNSWEIVDGVASDDYDPTDSDTFWTALDTVLASAKAQGIRLPDYVDDQYKLDLVIPENVYGLNKGDTVEIGDDTFTYHHSYGVTDHGFITGTIKQCGQFCDGIHQHGVDRQGRVEVAGALIGEIRDGKFSLYANPKVSEGCPTCEHDGCFAVRFCVGCAQAVCIGCWGEHNNDELPNDHTSAARPEA